MRRELRRQGFLEDINNVLNTGEVRPPRTAHVVRGL
jgi:hypothetical protein